MASVESTSTDEIVVENHLSGGNRCRQTCGTRLVLACCPNSWLGNWLVVYTTVQKFKIKHFSIFLTNPIRRNKIKYTKATDIKIYVESIKATRKIYFGSKFSAAKSYFDNTSFTKNNCKNFNPPKMAEIFPTR